MPNTQVKSAFRIASAMLAMLLITTACAAPAGLRRLITARQTAAAEGGKSVPLTREGLTSRGAENTPAEALRRAVKDQENGSYEAACAGFQPLVQSAEPEVRRTALFRLGQASLQAGDYQAATDALQRFIDGYPADPEVATAYFWLGQALAARGDGQAAAAAYRDYLQRRPLLESYVQERIGDALAAAGDHKGAIVAYRAATQAETQVIARVRMLESLARSERALENYEGALGAYEEVLQVAKTASYRAQIMYEAGATAQAAGLPAGRWNELIATYPETPWAARALAALDEAGLAQVDTFTRAQVYYGAGRYSDALLLLQRLIRGGAQSHGGDVHYYAALCNRALDQHQDALREFEALIAEHPANDLVPEAWFQEAETLALLGAVDQAAATFQQMAAGYPGHWRAVQALWRAAQVYDEAGRSWDASTAYTQAAATYPDATYAADARFRAGFTHYLNQAIQTAADTWANLLPQETDPAMRARLLLWLGKAAQQLGNPVEAQEKWSEAAATAPNRFWGLRAQDLLAGRRFIGQAPPGALAPALYALQGDPAEAENWLIGWAGAPPDGEPLSGLPAALTDMDEFKRGSELWKLGDQAAAVAALRLVQAAYADNPHALYTLALYCRDQGLYLLATVAAEQLLGLAPPAARANTPRFIEELAYPTYYADLVLHEAQATNTDPLLFFGLVRQESYFDSHATSYSDARGLAQVMPSTGEYIAGKLGETWPGPDSLWRPVVSVRYGMWYITSALRMFDDNALIALVAYNAGPGNATTWNKLSQGDDDIFFEQVSNRQPRSYMEKIYEHRAHYERLYR